MNIDCVSDLHGFYPKLEGGDLLIVAGDLTASDELFEHYKFGYWLKHQHYKKKIIIAGNHDNRLQKLGIIPWDSYFHCSSYLCDSGTKFEGLKIWGSPWTKTFKEMNPDCKAFTVDTEEELAEKWALVPDDMDILITHSPALGVLDKTVDGRHVGSYALSAKIGGMHNLKLHIFGHIHESYGKIDPPPSLPNYFDLCEHYSVNASHVDEKYRAVNKPVRITL